MRDKALYDDYIKRVEKIRSLSTIPLDNIDTAEDYQEKLRSNFTHIGELAALNRDFLDNDLFALINDPRPLEDDDEELLTDFSNSLVTAYNSENIDLSIVSIIQEKLINDKNEQKDLEKLVKYEDLQIGVYYELMLMTSRIVFYPEISDKYRQKGFKLARAFMQLLQKDHFATIDDPDLKDMILTNVRYGASFYEGIYGNVEINKENIAYLKMLYEIAEDPFYVEAMGEDFDWTYYMFRLLQYTTVLSEGNNITGFNEEQLEFIYEKSVEFEKFWQDNKEYIDRELSDTEDYSQSVLSLIRGEYLTGRMKREEYFEKLLELYYGRDMSGYSAGDYSSNLIVPNEIIALIDKDHISEKEKSILANLYNNMISYAFSMPNDGTFIFFLELFCKFMGYFIEIPSVITYEDMMLQTMAALHPPTYVHTQMVGRITECLCSHLIRLMPEKLIGVKGTKSVEEVLNKKDEIISFAYHSALCHDCGKLYILDVIFIYGRKLLDMEFELIKTHPRTGYEYLSGYASTREYAEVALGHHKWHDDSRGYPEDISTKDSKVKSIIDLVLCADCLDAATDTVGRSYNKGKTVETFTEELKEGSGDRYAPWLVDLFSDPLVKDDIRYLLTEGRQLKYKEIYYLLKNVNETAEKQGGMNEV